MKILYLHCTADLYGASRMMLRNITQQIRDGYEIHVILPYKGVLIEELEKIGANVYITYLDPTVRKSYFKNPIKFILFIYNCFRAVNFYKKITKQLKIDLIVSNSSQIVVGGFLAKSKKIPHICHVRESYLENLIFWKIFEPFLLYTSDLLICVSQAMANQFYSKNNKDKVVVVHDGFPLDEFKEISKERVDKFKTKFNLNNFLIIGLVGRLIIKRKGQEVFIKAAAILNKKYPDVRFVCIGSCYPGNEFHLVNLNNLVKNYSLNNIVIFTGEVSDIKAVYKALDVSVMASGNPEPFGGVTLESMAYHTPVVGTNIGGTPEQIIDGITGILIPPNHPEKMADALEKLILDPKLRVDMGKEGYKHFKNKFLFEPYYERIKYYYDLISITS